MSGSHKYLKELRLTVENAGLALLSMAQKRKHWHLIVKTPDGREGKFIASKSPSCRRSLKNLTGDLRRFARADEDPR